MYQLPDHAGQMIKNCGQRRERINNVFARLQQHVVFFLQVCEE